ncbi:FAD:protein FMN transferase [Bacillus marasmi]|uniref:FAD:protein FMN transferase n=1 Tax=Bacillus marasmi TaxID=1926279 RepID=UPI00164CE305|nr:FAD:protein FMN transferase [Bacillus marasmi]
MIVRQEERNDSRLESVQLNMMNTSFYIAVSDDYQTEWKSPIISYLQYIEREFSRFRPNNELMRLNEAKPATTIKVSPILFDLLQKAEAYRLQTDGRFSPYMLTQMEAHGYNQSFPFKVANSEAGIVHHQMVSQPLTFLDGCRLIKNTEQKIDLGGIAKGYAVEAIAKWLQKHTKSNYGIVDGGGDMSMWSNGDKTWTIGVMDPFNEEEEIGSFSIRNGGIATSNIIYRSWLQGQCKKHHILDGRTGMPVISEIVQATIVTEHCLDAEISAKICFMDDLLSVKPILSKISPKFNYVLVNSRGKIEMGGSENHEQ